MDLVDLTQEACLERGSGALVGQVRAILDAHLRDHARSLGGGGDGTRFLDGTCQRLLTVAMQAACQRCQQDGRVHVVRRGDMHRVDVITLAQKLAPIAIQPRLGMLLGGLLEESFVHIAQRHDVHVGMLGDLREIAAAHASHADAGMAQTALCALARRLRGNRRTMAAYRGQCGRSCGCLQEGPTSEKGVTSPHASKLLSSGLDGPALGYRA